MVNYFSLRGTFCPGHYLFDCANNGRDTDHCWWAQQGDSYELFTNKKDLTLESNDLFYIRLRSAKVAHYCWEYLWWSAVVITYNPSETGPLLTPLRTAWYITRLPPLLTPLVIKLWSLSNNQYEVLCWDFLHLRKRVCESVKAFLLNYWESQSTSLHVKMTISAVTMIYGDISSIFSDKTKHVARTLSPGERILTQFTAHIWRNDREWGLRNVLVFRKWESFHRLKYYFTEIRRSELIRRLSLSFPPEDSRSRATEQSGPSVCALP